MADDLVVIGLGYVGLPLAQEAVRSGHRVVGLDTAPAVVDQLNAGRSHVDDLSDADIAVMVAGGFRATTDPACVGKADVVVICVPTPLDSDDGPDLGAVLAASRGVAAHVRPGTLVVLESTTYPGTTEDVLRPLLEADGLRVGEDLHLAFSPERIDPGNPRFGLRNTPKVVGGVTPACGERAAEFYRTVVDDVVIVPRAREAELTKLLENTYRHINIALVNEMAKFCHELDIDLWSVIDAAATKPFGFQPFRPGPGVGGHCIPIDPNYLSYKVRSDLGYPFRFVELAQEINSSMPAYVVDRVGELLARDGRTLDGARVLLLGVSYKRDIADDRETPSADVARVLHERGATVVYDDPVLGEWTHSPVPAERAGDLTEALASCDVAVLLQDHSAYDLDALASSGTQVLDTRGRLTGPSVERL
ncbi:MAG TPA: nucleotide sugar dehydrogenase [Candidatus Angelobacter sp.]|nr:nucleotide sugar dehydrogenase [Candidatus Angelobacter sp.]